MRRLTGVIGSGFIKATKSGVITYRNVQANLSRITTLKLQVSMSPVQEFALYGIQSVGMNSDADTENVATSPWKP